MNDYKSDIQKAIEVLKKGGLILYPTDTVWGIGCDANNAKAIKRVFDLKRRADSKALITLVPDTAMLERTVDCVPDVAYQLIELSDRPVTIVYDKGLWVDDSLLADDRSLAVRVTSEPFSNALCRAFRKPLVSTSANISGAPTPAVFADISKEIIDGVDYVCESRRNEPRHNQRASMIIKISDNNEFKLIRK